MIHPQSLVCPLVSGSVWSVHGFLQVSGVSSSLPSLCCLHWSPPVSDVSTGLPQPLLVPPVSRVSISLPKSLESPLVSPSLWSPHWSAQVSGVSHGLPSL